MGKAREVGGNNARAGVTGLPDAVKATAFASDHPWVPRGYPATLNPAKGLPKQEEAHEGEGGPQPKGGFATPAMSQNGMGKLPWTMKTVLTTKAC